jgi:hypothetical protein
MKNLGQPATPGSRRLFLSPLPILGMVTGNLFSSVICAICGLSLLLGLHHVSNEIDLRGFVTRRGVESGCHLAVAHHQDGVAQPDRFFQRVGG